MTRRAQTSHIVRAMLLVAAVSAAVPSVRWCPMRWDEIAPDLFLRCVTAAAIGSPACAMSFEGNAPPAPHAACRWVGTACRSGCAVAGPSAGSREGRESCPLVAAGPAAAPASSPPSSSRHGRAYWLGDAAYTRALRSQDPRLDAPALTAGPSPAITDLERPVRRSEVCVPLADAAPLVRLANPPPPARAPPSEA